MNKRIESPLLKALSLLVMLTIVLGGFSPAAPASAAVQQAADPDGLMFIENAGQFGKSARFQAAAGSSTLWLAEDALWISQVSEIPGSDGKPETVQIANVRISFEGANGSPELEPFNRLNTVVSYFHGDDPAKWQANVPVWGGVRYLDLYPGIDLEISSEQGVYAQRLIAQPGADLSAVKLNVEGVDSLQVEGDQILFSTPLGKISFPLLQISQASQFRLPAPELAGLQVNHPFTQSRSGVKPAGQNVGTSDLLFSTYLGGAASEYNGGLAVDANDNVYMTGATGWVWEGENFPTTPGVFDSSIYNSEVWVAKFNASGTPIFISYLGGQSTEEGLDIACDSSGNVYVTGTFTNNNPEKFPTTVGAYDRTTDEMYRDAFISVINASGTALTYSTYIGGDGSADLGYSIAVDSNGDIYVTGTTQSAAFPTTSGAFDTSYNGGYTDSFILKLSPDGLESADLIYSTFLGGDASDDAVDLAINPDNQVFVSGHTESTNFPATVGALSETLNGVGDAFVAKLNATGSALVYATYLGGESYSESANSIAIDASGAAYVAGYTMSRQFPVTPGAFDTSLGPNQKGFVTKLNPAGSGLVYSTFVGGNTEWSHVSTISVDASGAAYIAGATTSTDFPTTAGTFDNSFNGSGGYYSGDAFVLKLNPGGTGLEYSSYLGGSDDEYTYGSCDVGFDSNGDAIITGETRSANFPISAGAFDTTLSGTDTFDIFLTKLDVHASTIAPPALASPASGKKTNDKTPTFTWNAVDGGYQYRLQISRNNTFSTLVRNALVLPGKLTFTTTALNDGQYYWRVAAYDAGKNIGAWSNTRTFTVDTVKPAAPVLTSPANNATIKGIPTYIWKSAAGAKYYQVSYATNATFTSGVVTSSWLTVLQYKPAAQAKGTYWWRVRAKDAAGNIGSWSAVRKVILK